MDKFTDYINKKLNEEVSMDIIKKTTDAAEMAFWATVEESLASAGVKATIIPVPELREAMKNAIEYATVGDGTEETPEARAFKREFRPEPRKPREVSPEEKAFEKEFDPDRS